MTKPIKLPVSHRMEDLTSSPQTPSILVEIVYGLINRDCKGMGICKINHTTQADLNSTTRNVCASSYAYLQVESPTIVRLWFLRNSISVCQYEHRFQRGYFLLEEPYVFTEEWRALLDLEQAIIDVGIYPIQTSEAYLQVDLPITKKPKSLSV